MPDTEALTTSQRVVAPTVGSRQRPAGPAAAPELTPLVTLNIALRGLMEAGIALALAVWGYHAGSSVTAKLLLAFGAPLVGFGFWGAIDFRQAGRLAEPLRLIQELTISVVAGIALIAAGRPIWGLALLALSAVHHALVYALGQRLLKGRKS
jgi:hypothetical protein